ncbi:APC family permease [Anaerosalibacter bizertensis]|uniref:APC family permease n=1 Tax=Anaerosalibacter bizertensis TaxID=932217 RepID=UPI001C0EC11D|nr:APC family permease [Anaerosalibacter bizertensis]MBU5294589.1 APC family permease [Anaerosalibacter bizertensis]
MNENKLHRELSLKHLIALAAGGMIGGWMVEIKYWFELSGAGSFWALLTTAVLVFPLCLVYSELSSMLPFAGGVNTWISNAFNWDLGWYSAWFVLLLYVLAMPTVTYGIATMAGYLFPITFAQVKIIALIVTLTWLVITNLRVGILAKVQSVMFWIMVIVSAFASINFILDSEWSYQTLTPWFPKGFSGYGAAVGLLIMKFIGFDLIPQLCEETNFPHKDIWKAFAGSLVITVLIYGLAVFGIGGIVTNEWIANTDVVDPRVADLIGKHWLAYGIVISGLFACLTTISGFWLSASRTLYGAAKQRQISGSLTAINKYGQPWKANIVVGIFALYFTVFAPEDWLNYIYTIYGLTAGIVYLMVSLSFIKLRKTKPDWERPYKAPGGIILGVLALIYTLWIIYISLKEITETSLIILLGYLGVGICLHLYAKHKQKVDPENWAPKITTIDDIDSTETI